MKSVSSARAARWLVLVGAASSRVAASQLLYLGGDASQASPPLTLELSKAVEIIDEAVDGLQLIGSGGGSSHAVLKYNSNWDNATYRTLTPTLASGPPLTANVRGSKTFRPPKFNFFKDRSYNAAGLASPNSALAAVLPGEFIACEIADGEHLAPCGDISEFEGRWVPTYKGVARHCWWAKRPAAIERTVQNLHLQCASLLETFSVSVDTPLTLSVQNT